MLKQEMVTLSSQDVAAAEEVRELAYDYLFIMADARAERGDAGLLTDLTGKGILQRPYCFEASDAVTRAAHTLGIAATRELHGGHYLTSFADHTDEPAEDDPIMDFTWGQLGEFPLPTQDAYFGSRSDIRPLVPRYYKYLFSAASLKDRQVAYFAPDSPAGYSTWLRGTQSPDGRPYPMGEVAPTDFPAVPVAETYRSRNPIW